MEGFIYFWRNESPSWQREKAAGHGFRSRKLRAQMEMPQSHAPLLWTKCWNTWAWGGHFSYKPSQSRAWPVVISMDNFLDWWLCVKGCLTVVGTTPGHIVLGCKNKVSWASHWEQVNRQLSSIVPASVPAAVPTLTCLHDGLWSGYVRQISPFLPKVLLVMMFITIKSKLVQ